MSATIFCFSGTGNSLAIARTVAKGLDADVQLIPDALDKTAPLDADCVGIVFPVYMWGPPLMVARFARNLRLKPDTYCFAVTNYGGMPGATLQILAKQLKQADITLAAGFGVQMPGNYTPMYGAIPEAKQTAMFDTFKQQVDEIIAAVRERRSTKLAGSNPFVRALFSGLIYKTCSPRIPSMDKGFWVDDRCTGCGRCYRMCPSGNIQMSGGKPAWQHRCEQCMACLQWCPEEAIQLGKKTATRKRYRHPDITAQDLTYRTVPDSTPTG
jgi:NAD-dependent dihydropyrimidine dehydrogenase PreA subunit